MYAQKEDRKKKLLFSIRVAFPILFLFGLLFFVVVFEKRSVWYDLFIIFLGTIAAVYYIFLMLFSQIREKIVDDISQAFNRNYIKKLVEKSDEKSDIVLISIDNIKEINERYGIENGDAVLRKFAFVLDAFFSKYFKEIPIGRIKAGDFLLILPNSEKIEAILKEFLETYDNSFLDNFQIRLLASFMQKDHLTFKQLVDGLYEDIYYCQNNCIGERRERHLKKRRDILRLERQVNKAIDQKKLELLFQPAFNCHTKQYDLVQTIVKLKDENGSIIHPSQFYPVINRLGLENRFDLVLTEKLLQTVSKDLPTQQLFFCIPISPFSFRNRRFALQFFKLFDSLREDTCRFVIQFHETTLHKNTYFSEKIVQEYKKRNFLLAFDHFGTSGTSIDYLKDIAIDFVFFDKMYTKKLEEQRYQTVLKYWIDMLHALDVQAVLPFIDKEENVQKCESLGVDYIQGYAVAPLMEYKTLKEFIGEKHAIW
ncbi:GGDEF domain-containing protein [Nitratiruptor sp. SB155-2]|uniref:GGDEF domain-containing protein n=1 Tax=Nitratiruptor sp. (strain SB155-2) TaxID=387092 RepID=UPI0001586DF6|nr:GGDEF domain-containing protein [Nitratiruptor sp. SB155-2]BAF69122.1 conserved hypothetical protein [Nitratiruptor sp. SB155-2]